METLRLDLIIVGFAYIVFMLGYLANMLFSLFDNMQIKGQPFDKAIMKTSIKKAVTLVLATFALVVAVDVAMIFLSAYVPELAEKAKDTVTVLMVVGTIGRAALKYIVEAYNTFTNVLNGKPTEVVKALDNKE